MGVEIERKFLLRNDDWRATATGNIFRQGYLSVQKDNTVRVRTIGDKGYLTIKGASKGATRLEYEYQIPIKDACSMLDRLCLKPLIEKQRYTVEHHGKIWEIDEFFGENEGLIVAEIELDSEDQIFIRPDWVGLEVTSDPRYFNANLVSYPYCRWKEQK